MATDLFSAHGFAFRVRSSCVEVEAVFDDLLCDLAVRPGDGAAALVHTFDVEPLDDALPGDPLACVRVELDGDELYPVLRAGSLVSHLLIEVNRQASAKASRLVPLHAGAVATPQGAVLLGGASESGKTTLTTALALAGHRFVADEVSMVDVESRLVHPYGKPVALRPASVELLHDRVPRLAGHGSWCEADERFVPPSELGGLASEAVPLAALVLPRFESGAELELEPLSPGEVLMALMRLVLGEGAQGVERFHDFEHLARYLPAARVRYGDIGEALATVGEWLAR